MWKSLSIVARVYSESCNLDFDAPITCVQSQEWLRGLVSHTDYCTAPLCADPCYSTLLCTLCLDAAILIVQSISVILDSTPLDQ